MPISESAKSLAEQIRTVRQARLFSADPVPDEALDILLQIARWTGSGRNTQPWQFIVIRDREQLRKLSELRTPINWVADAPLAIAIVMDGKSPSTESFDEGRLTERILIGAKVLGLGGGTAWYGEEEQEAEAKRILNIPPERLARSMVVIGKPTTTRDHRPNANTGGRKPLDELVHFDRLDRRSV